MIRIATLGPEGTYSDTAVRLFGKRLGAEDIVIEYTTIPQAFRLVEKRECSYAIAPIENSVDGIIGTTIDFLIEHQDFVKVCDEIYIPIRHRLAAKSRLNYPEIERIYSHPSAINQCASKLSERAPQAKIIPVSSTTEAARMAMEDPTGRSAAICSQSAICLYGLTVISEDIQDYEENYTRFFAAGLTDGEPTGNDRTLLAIRYGEDKPGVLYGLISEFASRNINLTFIQSRPYKIRPNQYVLVIEAVGHKRDPIVEEALKAIDRRIKALDGWKKILGSYPRRSIEEIFE